MKTSQELKALYRALKLYGDLSRLEVSALEYRRIRDLNPKDLDERERREYWDVRIKYERLVDGLVSKVGRFIKDYGRSPILDSFTRDDDEFENPHVTVGFVGESVKGFKKLFLSYGEWFREVKLPKAPKRLVEVYG